MEPWAATWLAHQRRDDYWRQGSACERYADIACPVFAVGGWSDGYRDMVLRMVEHIGAPVRGLIGPWGHTGPEAGAPGPGDRLPAGGRALLRPRAQGRGERVLRRAGADQLHAGADRAGDRLRRAAGALGRRRGVAVAERGDAGAAAGGAARSMRGAAAHRARGGRVVRRRRAGRRRRPTSGPRTARRCAGTSSRSGERTSCSATWWRSSRWRPTGRSRSSPCGCATSRPTAAPRSSPAACSTSPTARGTTGSCRSCRASR